MSNSQEKKEEKKESKHLCEDYEGTEYPALCIGKSGSD